MYVVKRLKIVHIFIFEHIQVLKCFARMRISTSNSKHGSFLYKKIMNISTQKGEHSCKCTELSLKQKEGIQINLILQFITETYFVISDFPNVFEISGIVSSIERVQ